MHRIAVKANTGWMETGAASKPHSPVKTTSVITRGFVSARKSRQSAVIADDVVPIIGLLAIALSRWLASRPMIRSEEHTSELQSLMRISYAVFCLKQKKYIKLTDQTTNT